MSNTTELHSNQESNSSISKNTTTEITVSDIQNLIISLPNRPKAMLAKDLAKIYDVETGHLNRAVKRNPDRFPPDFYFQATENEVNSRLCQFGITKESAQAGNPYLFTREGANMLSAVLHSKVAVERSVQIMRAFSQMEQAKAELDQPNDQPPSNDTYYVTTLHNPPIAMHIAKKNCSSEHSRWIDFGAGVMFPVQRDNSIQMSEHQYNKVLDIIGMELKSMVNYGFNNGVFGKREISVEDNPTLSLPEQPDRFSQLESTQEMLQIRLAAATSQIEELKALRVAEDAIRTKAQIGDKKVATALGKAGGLAKQNKKLQQENQKLKKLLNEQNIFNK